MNFIKAVLVSFFCTIIISCQAQFDTQKLDEKINSIYKKSDFPGFAIAILKADSTIFCKGYGFSNIEKKIPYTLKTIQPIASVSKTFIALSVMKAIELGHFTLETNINDLLPFKIINPNFPNSIITVSQLATHTSSLLDNDTIYFNTFSLGTKPMMELGTFMRAYFTPNGKFYDVHNFDKNEIGSNYAYSNIASALLAYIIEVKSKMDFTTFTNTYIFKPLKMQNSQWFTEDTIKDEITTLYQITVPENPLYYKLMNPDNSLKPYSFITYPDGGLLSSVNDLSIYLKCMMNGYFNKKFDLISKESYQNLFTKQFLDGKAPTNMDLKEPNRAIFWSYTKNGDIRHTGSSAGVFAFISFDPIKNIGRVMTMNACLEGGNNIKQVNDFKKIINAITEFEKTIP